MTRLILLLLIPATFALDQSMANENVNSFDAVDADNNGWIDFPEFSKWVRSRNSDEARRSIKEIFSQYDVDADSRLGVAEFVPLAYAFSQKPVDTEETIFKRMDKNGDGTIDVGEQEVLRRTGEGAVIDGVLAVADTNRDGRLDYSEFQKALSQNHPKSQEEKDQDTAQSIITYIDADGDRLLKRDEVLQFARKYSKVNSNEIHQVFGRLDSNMDDVLDLNELARFPSTLTTMLHLAPPPTLS
ncbi:unnamed protein product, partial [Mesorhabditis spiculigera]